MVRQFTLFTPVAQSGTPSAAFARVPLSAEVLERREVPSVSGLEDVYSQPHIPGTGTSYPTDLQPAQGPRGNSILGQERVRYVVGTDGNGTAQVNVYDARTNTYMGSVTPFGLGYKGGITVATGDVTGDGIEDVIVSQGRWGDPVVKIFDGTTLAEKASFYAYSKSFHGGVSVAVGDVNGDGRADIITGAGVGSVAQIKVFSGTDIFALPGSKANNNPTAIRNFVAFDKTNRAGVSVATGDVNNDGKADIVVGSGVGVAGEVRVFSGANTALLQDLTGVGGATYTGGVSVAAGDVNGDGKAEVVAGQLTGGSQVWVYNQGKQVAEFAAYSGKQGVRVAVHDITGDKKGEVIAVVATGTPRVRVFNATSGEMLRDFPGFMPNYTAGLTVG